MVTRYDTVSRICGTGQYYIVKRSHVVIFAKHLLEIVFSIVVKILCMQTFVFFLGCFCLFFFVFSLFFWFTYPNGNSIKSGGFTDLRSWYKNDQQWTKVQNAKDETTMPVFVYHRFS